MTWLSHHWPIAGLVLMDMLVIRATNPQSDVCTCPSWGCPKLQWNELADCRDGETQTTTTSTRALVLQKGGHSLNMSVSFLAVSGWDFSKCSFSPSLSAWPQESFCGVPPVSAPPTANVGAACRAVVASARSPTRIARVAPLGVRNGPSDTFDYIFHLSTVWSPWEVPERIPVYQLQLQLALPGQERGARSVRWREVHQPAVPLQLPLQSKEGRACGGFPLSRVNNSSICRGVSVAAAAANNASSTLTAPEIR